MNTALRIYVGPDLPQGFVAILELDAPSCQHCGESDAKSIELCGIPRAWYAPGVCLACQRAKRAAQLYLDAQRLGIGRPYIPF